MITMTNRTENKHEDKEQGQTQHETPRSKNHKAHKIWITQQTPP